MTSWISSYHDKIVLIVLYLVLMISCVQSFNINSIRPTFIDKLFISSQNRVQEVQVLGRKLYGSRFPSDNDDISPSKRSASRPTIISPNRGVHPELEKFMMMYTCKICQNRNAQMISKVAYQHGMVVSTCSQCNNRHLIADNQGKLDYPGFNKRVDQLLEQQGEVVQKITLSSQDLEKYYLVDHDGVIKLVPKDGGQLDENMTVIEYPEAPPQHNIENK